MPEVIFFLYIVYWQDHTASYFTLFLNKGEWWPESYCLLSARCS